MRSNGNVKFKEGISVEVRIIEKVTMKNWENATLAVKSAYWNPVMALLLQVAGHLENLYKVLLNPTPSWQASE